MYNYSLKEFFILFLCIYLRGQPANMHYTNVICRNRLVIATIMLYVGILVHFKN